MERRLLDFVQLSNSICQPAATASKRRARILVAKGQKLILRSQDFRLQLACEVASCRDGKKCGTLFFKPALFAGDRGDDLGGDARP